MIKSGSASILLAMEVLAVPLITGCAAPPEITMGMDADKAFAVAAAHAQRVTYAIGTRPIVGIYFTPPTTICSRRT